MIGSVAEFFRGWNPDEESVGAANGCAGRDLGGRRGVSLGISRGGAGVDGPPPPQGLSYILRQLSYIHI